MYKPASIVTHVLSEAGCSKNRSPKNSMVSKGKKSIPMMLQRQDEHEGVG